MIFYVRASYLNGPHGDIGSATKQRMNLTKERSLCECGYTTAWYYNDESETRLRAMKFHLDRSVTNYVLVVKAGGQSPERPVFGGIYDVGAYYVAKREDTLPRGTTH